MKNLFLSVALMFNMLTSFAHSGGHHHGEENQHERIWKYNNGAVATTGTFLTAKDANVYVEQKDEVISLSLKDLSKDDQQYVMSKILQIHLINSVKASEQIQSLEKKSDITILFFILIGAVLIGFLIFMAHKKNISLKISKRSLTGLLGIMALSLLAYCGDSSENPVIDPEINESATSDPEVIDLAFDPYKTKIATSWDDDYFYVASNGIPDHQMMVGITAWIAQVPTPQNYTDDNSWQIPLHTEYSDGSVTIADDLRRGAIAIAANGIPIFNPINASGLVSYDLGELDGFGGHSGRGDDYHYHIAPLHLETTSGNEPIAFALDGYAIYGSTEPDGSVMGTLDEFHGHVDDDGDFHYHGTDSYPYMFAKMRGKVTLGGTSPETQVEPQPMAGAFRGDPHPIDTNDLVITDMIENNDGNGYTLTYTISGVEGSVEYSWDENEFFTFVFNDVNGITTTETFQRNN